MKIYDINNEYQKKKRLLVGLSLLFLVVKKKEKKYNKWIMNYGCFSLRDPFVLNALVQNAYYYNLS